MTVNYTLTVTVDDYSTFCDIRDMVEKHLRELKQKVKDNRCDTRVKLERTDSGHVDLVMITKEIEDD